MDTYEFKVVLKVQVDAFDASDAAEVIEDIFGVGNEFGATVIECETALVGIK